jgi:anti-sigma regulatory factor (Ser/Thr protein kinase)
MSVQMEKPVPPWFFEVDDSTSALHRRADFVRYLRSYGADGEDYAAAELIFGEIVGNAVVHAPGPLEVLVDWPEGRATLHVSDEGAPIRVVRDLPDPMAEHGRGLAVANRLARGLSSTPTSVGKTIVAKLPVRVR